MSILYEISEDQLDTGLRGFPVGTCRTSRVDPNEGVSYVGYPIAELAYRDPEDVIYLLLHRELPNPTELDAFKADLRARSGLPKGTLEFLSQLPRDAHPMEWLMTGLLRMGMAASTGDWLEDGMNLIARAPELVAGIFRIRNGWGSPIPSEPDRGHIENFVHMLGVPGGADQGAIVQLLRVFYVLHMDHGGGNLSTFVGKATASSQPGMYPAITAAMAALYGPLHGRANQDCLQFVRKVGSSEPAAVERFVRDALANKEKIFGFGHAVLRAEDPRATIQYELGQRIYGNDPLFKVALTLREVAVRVLQEHPKISNPFPNVDAVSGTLLQAAGLTDANYYTVLFGLSRITGICAQIVDERTRFRGGRGVPIYRPSYKAADQPKRSVND